MDRLKEPPLVCPVCGSSNDIEEDGFGGKCQVYCLGCNMWGPESTSKTKARALWRRIAFVPEDE